jgi:hypothetical protein
MKNCRAKVYINIYDQIIRKYYHKVGDFWENIRLRCLCMDFPDGELTISSYSIII